MFGGEAAEAHPGIVEQQMHRAETREAGVGQGGDIGLAADIGGMHKHTLRCHVEAGCRLLQALGVEV
jgi:hypothetical protein